MDPGRIQRVANAMREFGMLSRQFNMAAMLGP
jgi:hypothetical protein